MHSWRSTLAVACLCLVLGASPAEWMIRLKAILTAVWENEVDQIDPFGAPRTNDADQIDPWGAPGTDEADQIDPFATTASRAWLQPWPRRMNHRAMPLSGTTFFGMDEPLHDAPHS